MKNNLVKLRQALNLSQKDFAAALGLPATTYHNYEKGLHNPDSELWVKVADRFNVTTDFLLGRTDKLTPPYWFTGTVLDAPAPHDEYAPLKKRILSEIENTTKIFQHTKRKRFQNYDLLKNEKISNSDISDDEVERASDE